MLQPGEPYYEMVRTLDRRGREARPRRAARRQRSRSSRKDPIDPGDRHASSSSRCSRPTPTAAVRDVTAEAFVESSNTEVATVDKTGLVTDVRRGEATMLARYEGAYAATTLDHHGRPHRLRLERPAGLQLHRRTGRREAQDA